MKTEGRGRTLDEWKLRPERSDNHWFDGIVGCAVAASIQGTSLESTQPTKKKAKLRRSMSQMQVAVRERRAQRGRGAFYAWWKAGGK